MARPSKHGCPPSGRYPSRRGSAPRPRARGGPPRRQLPTHGRLFARWDANAGRHKMPGMPRCPSFYLLGALAGLVLWLIEAPPPFPFFGLTAMVAGALGLVLSLAYI